MSSSTAGVPRVSVVLPVWNGAATIAETLASVLAQFLTDFELLVIDDGSTDGTAEIVRAIGDERVQLHSFPNRGLAASRNRGIALARAPLIAFVDADDLWLPGKLADQVAALAAHPDAGLAYSWSDCIDAAGRPTGPGSHVAADGHAYAALVERNFLDNGSTALVRAAAFAAVGNFDETLAAAEDWDMWLRIAHAFPIACVARVQVRYRIHGGAMSSNIRRQEAACLEVLDRALARLPAGPERDQLGRLGRASLYRYLAGRVVRTAEGRAAGRLAFRYLGRLVAEAPSLRPHLVNLCAQAVRALLMVVLPAAWSAPLVARITPLRRPRP